MHPFESEHGGLSILIYAPATRDSQFDGLMVGIVRLKPWLDTVFARNNTAEYQTRIFPTQTSSFMVTQNFGEASRELWINQREYIAEQKLAKLDLLSTRERQVFELVAAGDINKSVAHDLHISERTVEVLRSQVMEKLEVRTLAQLVSIKIVAELHESG